MADGTAVQSKNCLKDGDSMVCMISRDILPALPNKIREIIVELPGEILNQIEEIRLRYGKPLIIGLTREDVMVTSLGQVTTVPEFAYMVTDQDMKRTVQLISGSSIYAFEEELKNGFITIRGGHRVGISGKVVVDRGKVKTIKYINGLNIRVAREVAGAADTVLPYLVDPVSGEFSHTLIISPPRCGKTTLLRDIVRQVSSGIPKLNFKGVPVGVVDERSEIAGCYHGIPQKDIGNRTDVLDGCPKAEGMMMLIRAMGPRIIAADEIGRQEDAAALEEALNGGIKVLTTAHGSGREEISQRPVLRYIIEQRIFERLIILGRSRGVGTIEDIIDCMTGKSLL
ncbi:stage III sporulation protein AA [Phosphitispora sp. TUW77]|uniref:stage III sporulation protein AA n=1 Tax=Phosphitispora sp. TUW77 TaxID=3152361 RepID=UPI003AB57A29